MQLKIIPFLLLFFMVTAAGHSEAADWQLKDITGHLPDLQFSLTADNGQPVTAADYKGHVVLLYFGFTGCAAQCPVVMNRLAEVLRSLGQRTDKGADNVRLLFVSVDPFHDTPASLHHYIGLFDARHTIGLTGNESEIQALAKRYRTLWQPSIHGSAIYIFDAEGHARLLATPADPDESLLHDLKELASS